MCIEIKPIKLIYMVFNSILDLIYTHMVIIQLVFVCDVSNINNFMFNLFIFKIYLFKISYQNMAKISYQRKRKTKQRRSKD